MTTKKITLEFTKEQALDYILKSGVWIDSIKNILEHPKNHPECILLSDLIIFIWLDDIINYQGS